MTDNVLLQGGRFVTGDPEVPLTKLLGFGADGGYLRSNGSAWTRVAGVAWSDITSAPDFALDNSVVKLTGDQSVAGQKTFTGYTLLTGGTEIGDYAEISGATYAGLYFRDRSETANEQYWGVEVKDALNKFRMFAYKSASPFFRDFLTVTRDDFDITEMEYGNATNKPPHTFHGNVTISEGSFYPNYVEQESRGDDYVGYWMHNTEQPATSEWWGFEVIEKQYRMVGYTNTTPFVRNFLTVNQDDGVQSIIYGNATDNPSHTFHGEITSKGGQLIVERDISAAQRWFLYGDAGANRLDAESAVDNAKQAHFNCRTVTSGAPTAGSLGYLFATNGGTRLTIGANGDLMFTGTLTGGTVPWARLSSVPTTLAGYGITDATVTTSGGTFDVDGDLGTAFRLGSTGSFTNRGPSSNNAGGLLSFNTHPNSGTTWYYSQFWLNSGGGAVYYRTRSGTAWGAWVRLNAFDSSDVLVSGFTVPWARLTSVPATFAPSAHTHPVSDITGRAVLTRGTGLTGANYDLSAAATWAVSYGSAAGTACQGNDSRLANSREWTATTVTLAEAELGTATTRRAWTAAMVHNAARRANATVLVLSATRNMATGDKGAVIYKTSTSAFTLTTVDSAMANGDMCLIQNRATAGNITVALGTSQVIHWFRGNGTAPATGARTIGIGGTATLIKIATNTWHIFGGGIS